VAKKKLIHFAENETFDHFFQPDYDELSVGFRLKGAWNTKFFNNSNPITVELGCGKGEFTVGLALKYPERNFIGIDLKGARLWRGAKDSKINNLKNVAFIRTRVELVEFLFAPGEISEIWITFPDPQPKQSKAKKRLTSPQFLDRYRKVCVPEPTIHLKTDNASFFDYTLETIREQSLLLLSHSYNVDEMINNEEVTSIRTYYEEKFRKEGVVIKYLKYTLK